MLYSLYELTHMAVGPLRAVAMASTSLPVRLSMVAPTTSTSAGAGSPSVRPATSSRSRHDASRTPP